MKQPRLNQQTENKHMKANTAKTAKTAKTAAKTAVEFKLKLSTIAEAKRLVEEEQGQSSNYDKAHVANAWSEIASGRDAGQVILKMTREIFPRGSWGAQRISAALKTDKELLAAGLKVGAFRNTGGKGSAPKKGNRKARKATPGKGGQRESALSAALKGRDAVKFAAAIAAELGGAEALAFIEAVYAALEA